MCYDGVRLEAHTNDSVKKPMQKDMDGVEEGEERRAENKER